MACITPKHAKSTYSPTELLVDGSTCFLEVDEAHVCIGGVTSLAVGARQVGCRLLLIAPGESRTGPWGVPPRPRNRFAGPAQAMVFNDHVVAWATTEIPLY